MSNKAEQLIISASHQEVHKMKVKFTNWNGDADTTNQYITIKTNEWIFEVDGKSCNWSIRREEYFDSEGDGKGDGYYIHDNLADELIMDTTWKGWMEGSQDSDLGDTFEKADWKINDISGLDFIFKVNEHFENSDCGWGLFSFPDAGLSEDRVIGEGEFEIN